MKKMAFGLFGTSYNPNYKHWSGRTKVVDFRKSFYNYKKNIFDYFSKENFEIDVFISTFENELKDNLLLTYNPKKAEFYRMFKNAPQYYPKNYLIIKLLESIIQYSKQNNVKYDNLLLTRFDLEFLIPFNKLDNQINYSQFNNFSILEHQNVICDNFYLMPFNFIEKFLNIFLKNKNSNPHYFKNQFIENFEKINYIHNEYVGIAYLKSYTIIHNWK